MSDHKLITNSLNILMQYIDSLAEIKSIKFSHLIVKSLLSVITVK